MEASESIDAFTEQRYELEERGACDDGPGFAVSEASEGSDAVPPMEVGQDILEMTDGGTACEREASLDGEESRDTPTLEAHFPDTMDETSVSEAEQLRSAELTPNESDQEGSDDDPPGEEDDVEGEEDASDNDVPLIPPLPPQMSSTLAYELSRDVMFNKYAGATPSTQEQQSTAQPPSWVAFDSASSDASTVLPLDATHVCSSTACQQLMHWKDERIHELQRALDQMVEAMAIQQRDLAAQRALLSRQSEHFTKLSMALHHEKMAMQLSRERLGSAGRSRSQRTNLSAGVGVDSRRSTMPHVHSLPDMTGAPRASIAIVEPPRVKARRSLLAPPPLPLTVLPLDDQTGTVSDLREKSKSLSALEIRATTPQMPTIHEIDKFSLDEDAPPVMLSEVSLHDCEPSTAASTGTSDSSSDLLHGDPQPSTPQPDSAKKWSLGGRFRSIRWKS